MDILTHLATTLPHWPEQYISFAFKEENGKIVESCWETTFWLGKRSTWAWIGYTRADYEAKRAELQSKPSWDSHRFKYIAQDESGDWFGYMLRPDEIIDVWISDTRFEYLSTGKVIGDWRDTLEARP